MALKDYRAVVFDMDGVIFDSERAVLICWQEVAKKHDIQNLEEAFLACTGTTMQRTREIMLERYGDDFPYDAFAKEASVLFHERYDNGRLPVKIGVRELLEYLKAEGKMTAIASSTRRSVVIQELSDAGLLDYFDEVIGGDMVEKSKPEPDIYLKACEKLGVNPSDSYAIEDSFNGVRSAYRGHLKAIMVPDLIGPNDEMKDIAEVILENLLCVKEYLMN